VFENRVLRMFQPKRDEMTRHCRKLHNEELHNLHYPTYYKDDQINVDEIGGTCRTNRSDEKCIQGFG
jgi:hypothetical protein